MTLLVSCSHPHSLRPHTKHLALCALLFCALAFCASCALCPCTHVFTLCALALCTLVLRPNIHIPLFVEIFNSAFSAKMHSGFSQNVSWSMYVYIGVVTRISISGHTFSIWLERILLILGASFLRQLMATG